MAENQEISQQSEKLTPENVLLYSEFFQDQIGKKISKISLRAASIIDGKVNEGHHNFKDKKRTWEYIVERLNPIQSGEITVSITRFPVDQMSDIISEGMRFIIRNPKLVSELSVMEYHKKTKEDPNSEPISNNMATLAAGKDFLASI